MKRVLVSSAIMLMAATSVGFAADLPTSEPSYAPPAPAEVMGSNPWEGAYAGVSTGWIWGDTNSNRGFRGVDGDGFSLGAYTGYNLTYNDFVFGPELLANYNNIDDKSRTSRFEKQLGRRSARSCRLLYGRWRYAICSGLA